MQILLLTFVALLWPATSRGQSKCQMAREANPDNNPYECAANGDYKAKQCFIKDGQNMCICVYPESGRTIKNYRAIHEDTMSSMNCACAVRFVSKTSSKYDGSCMPNGNFAMKCVTKPRQTIPVCTADGYFRSTHCPGPMKNCFCVDMYSGQPIGYYEGAKGENADTMNCQCAQDEVDFKKTTTNACSKNGNYNKSVVTTETTVIGAITTTTMAPVVTATTAATGATVATIATTTMGTAQQTQCQLLAALYLKKQTRQKPLCDDDGTFQPVQCYDGWCYCALPNSGKTIARYSFSETSELRRTANCKCARDEVMYALSDQLLNAFCMKNGNYQSCLSEFWQDITSRIRDGTKATCDCKGKFARKQCNEEYCYCSNPNGQRIGFYRIPPKVAATKKCACECALEEDRMRAAGTLGLMRFDCDQMGDYAVDTEVSPARYTAPVDYIK